MIVRKGRDNFAASKCSVDFQWYQVAFVLHGKELGAGKISSTGKSVCHMF